MNLYQIGKYVGYVMFSGHRKGHGIHSPFVYDLVSRIFRNKMEAGVVLRIEKIRESLKNDKRVISVNDLGTGKDRSKTNLSNVSEIARYAAVPKKYGTLLYNLAAEYGKPSIIELGTSLGISTMYLAASQPGSTVYTIEGCGNCAAIARENFARGDFDNIISLTGPFDDVLPELLAEGVSPGLVFIDGNHRKEPLLKYFHQICEISDESAVFVIDDISQSAEMSEAWDIIRHSKKVTSTIDIFRMGIVFLRSSITRNHYKIRY